MTPIEIKKFLIRIERALDKLGFTVNELDNSYYCAKGSRHCIIVPYTSPNDFSLIPYNKCNNFIIISAGESINNIACNKVLTITELETLATKYKNIPLYRDLYDMFFFNYSLAVALSNIESIINGKKEKKNKEADLNSNNKETEYSIDIKSIEYELGVTLIKAGYSYRGKSTCVVPLISKPYKKGNYYWYGYHDYQIEELSKFKASYLALFFKNNPAYLLLPQEFVDEKLSKLNKTLKDDKKYWHFYFEYIDNKFYWRIPNDGLLDVSQYMKSRIKKDEPTMVNKEPTVKETVIKITSNSFHEAKR